MHLGPLLTYQPCLEPNLLVLFGSLGFIIFAQQRAQACCWLLAHALLLVSLLEKNVERSNRPVCQKIFSSKRECMEFVIGFVSRAHPKLHTRYALAGRELTHSRLLTRQACHASLFVLPPRSQCRSCFPSYTASGCFFSPTMPRLFAHNSFLGSIASSASATGSPSCHAKQQVILISCVWPS